LKKNKASGVRRQASGRSCQRSAVSGQKRVVSDQWSVVTGLASNFKFQISNFFLPLTSFLLLLTFLNSCKTNDQIPSYIRVQSYSFSDSLGQGTSSSKVTHIWVDVSTENRGAYQIPVSVPVLQQGLKTVSLQAGVKENGISANILPYPFYTTYKVQSTLKPGELDTINPKFQYLSNTIFAWTPGDFEGTGVVLETTNINSASTHLTTVKDSVFEGKQSYEVDFSPGHDTFDIQSRYTFNPTKLGTPVWLEMNYKTNVPMDVGVIVSISGSGTPTRELVGGINPINHWNKIYFNLSPTLQYWYQSGTAFKIYFYSQNTNGGTAHILLDNLKLLYF
jgi:hypothetical protein